MKCGDCEYRKTLCPFIDGYQFVAEDIDACHPMLEVMRLRKEIEQTKRLSDIMCDEGSEYLSRAEVAEAEVERLRESVERLRKGCFFLGTFIPDWADPEKPVEDGLCPTLYGTLTSEGDRKIQEKVKELFETLKECKAKE